MTKKFAVAVRTGYTYSNRFRPFVFEVEKITACYVFAAGFWNRATRYSKDNYSKDNYRFQFFDSEEEADNAAYMIRFRCKVLEADNAAEAAEAARDLADDLVRKEVMTWE